MNILMTIVCIVLVVFNLFYNTLLINLRFKAKMKCVTFGMCLFDAFNYLFCYCILLKPCKDKCFTPWSIIKWVIKAGVMGFTIYLVQQQKSEWEEAFEFGSLELERLERTRLDAYLIVYLLQHPIFMVARVPIFVLYSIITCCCDKGATLPDDFSFKDRIIGLDFVEYELGVLNNFEDHPVGRDEFQFNRRLSFARAQSIRGRPQPELRRSETAMQKISNKLGGTIYAQMTGGKPNECPFCYCEMAVNDRVKQLGCHVTHQFHEECLNNFLKHVESEPHLKLCPCCRKKIDEAAIVVKVLTPPPQMKIEDAFAINKMNNIDNVVNPTVTASNIQMSEMKGADNHDGLIHPPVISPQQVNFADDPYEQSGAQPIMMVAPPQGA